MLRKQIMIGKKLTKSTTEYIIMKVKVKKFFLMVLNYPLGRILRMVPRVLQCSAKLSLVVGLDPKKPTR
jgi:hypothetical protein